MPLTHPHFFIFIAQVKSKGDVRLVRLSSYILDVVAKRDLGREIDPERPPVVLMKMDIEGSELEVVPDLLVTGAMQHVNVTMIEWHWNITAKDRVQALVSKNQPVNCQFVMYRVGVPKHPIIVAIHAPKTTTTTTINFATITIIQTFNFF